MTASATTLSPYSALAAVYDRWTAANDFGAWGDDIARRFGENDVPAGADVLDLCCGTGAVSVELGRRGYRVTGVDRSPQMLDVARRRLGQDATLVEADLARPAVVPGAGRYAAAVCTFDSVNYFVADGALDALLATAAAALAPAGIFVFDVNTRTKLERVFGDSHYGDDLGDFAYVWRNRTDRSRHSTDFLITLFTSTAEGFTRSSEHHTQRWFDDDEIRAAAARHDFEVVSVTADYTAEQPDEQTLRKVWTLRTRPSNEDGDKR